MGRCVPSIAPQQFGNPFAAKPALTSSRASPSSHLMRWWNFLLIPWQNFEVHLETVLADTPKSSPMPRSWSLVLSRRIAIATCLYTRRVRFGSVQSPSRCFVIMSSWTTVHMCRKSVGLIRKNCLNLSGSSEGTKSMKRWHQLIDLGLIYQSQTISLYKIARDLRSCKKWVPLCSQLGNSFLLCLQLDRKVMGTSSRAWDSWTAFRRFVHSWRKRFSKVRIKANDTAVKETTFTRCSECVLELLSWFASGCSCWIWSCESM